MVKVKMKGKKRKYVTTAKSGSGSRNAKTRKGRKVNGDVQEDRLNVKVGDKVTVKAENPEDPSYVGQAWHGERELFDSHVTDWNYLGCVQGKCRVHTLEEYEALDSITQADFYQRFRYDPTSGHFDPDIVPVYCICEVPHNPDRDMVLCEHCKDWFHCDCVSFYPERNEESFCPQVDCQEAKTARAKKARAGAKLAKR